MCQNGRTARSRRERKIRNERECGYLKGKSMRLQLDILPFLLDFSATDAEHSKHWMRCVPLRKGCS